MDGSGRVIWITGLSCAVKTPVAGAIGSIMRARRVHAILLDGDELRTVFRSGGGEPIGYDHLGRLSLAMQYSRLCGVLARQGVTVIIATVSLFHEVHDWNRENLPGYCEVLIDVPTEVLEARDPKGLYRQYRTGTLTHMPGLDMSPEFPRHPDVHYQFREGHEAADTVAFVMDAIDASYLARRNAE